MAYAVIRLGGKQFKVQEGDTLKLERQMELSPEVLMYSDGDTTVVGEPIISDVLVKLSKVEDKRAKKVVVARFKSKSRYRKVNGHRQPISVLMVDSISKKGAAKEKVEKEPAKVSSTSTKRAVKSDKKEAKA